MIEKMIKKNIRLLSHILLLAVITTCCFSCETDLYETYSEYAGENVVSVGSPDSLSVESGFEKLLFKVFINADPKLKKGVIAWNLGGSEKTFNIDRTIYQNEIVEVEVDVTEGSYEFSVYMEDAHGNKSNTKSVFTQVLGEEYRASLGNRSLTNVRLYSETEAIAYWEPNTNELLIKTELTYISGVDGLEKVVVIDESEETVIIPDFLSEGSFSYKTFYKPSVDSRFVFETDSTEETFPVKP
ncbi:DUF4998 domain-containing protein [Mariniflexile sp. AS56]|uniref:DUF4998 domain-containing protein n=1 Tax=Mariniflexile sp. AS56 TaxID=3063957 RepID=UPI0026F35368|nr:DUF4998 domain-containing protein [Mariniflexile sp. AS56]MDO7171592.1 DUF4998 domain-containing protein [Mariniflexile sp. AS56]